MRHLATWRMPNEQTRVFAQTIRVLPESVDEYKALHARVWPEVLESLRDVGVLDMKIFHSGDRLFMFMTTVKDFRPEIDFARHLSMSKRCVEWSELTKTFQKPVPEAAEDDWWTYMEPVFDLRSQLNALADAQT